DYYHIMSCPEWEDADFDGDVADQSFPAWENVRLNGFERPAWFAQGPTAGSLAYLDARRSRPADAARSWQALTQQRVQTCRRLRRPPARRLLSRLPGARAVHHFADRVMVRLREMSQPPEDVTQALAQLQALFTATFPERQDRLEAADVINLLRV